MTKLILLIGLPGSGKSFLAQHLLLQNRHRHLVSTDNIRATLFGDEAIQGPWLQVWREVERQFRHAATQGWETIYDATNAARKSRREAILLARSVGFTHLTGLWLDMPLQCCLERNAARSRQVPEDVILKMHRQLNDAPPAIEDGLDQLIRWSREGLSTEIAMSFSAKTELTEFGTFDKLKLDL